MLSLRSVILLVSVIATAGCMTVETDNLVRQKPVASVTEKPDPAVIFANKNRKGDIAYREGYFGSGETRLHYVEAGEGPLIIFYHGFPSFWYSWFDQMEALKTSYRVVAVDGLGYGLSGRPADLELYDIANLTAQLDAFSRHLGSDEKYILIGHDWGSVLAFSYAQAYPKRLHKVVGMSAPPLNLLLKHTATDKEQQRRTQYMQRFKTITLEMLKASNAAQTVGFRSYRNLAARGDLTSEELELFRTALAENETIDAGMNWYRANIPAFDDVKDEDLWPAPDAKIDMPGLFITGDQDKIFVEALIDKVDDAGPHMRTVILKGINHWTSMEQPDQATREIVKFLKEESIE